MPTHTEGQYHCQVCGLTFDTLTDLAQHNEREHGMSAQGKQGMSGTHATHQTGSDAGEKPRGSTKRDQSR